MASLSHLDALNAEATFIMRETVAEAERPIIMYAAGKDFAILLHQAVKAFVPGTLFGNFAK